MTITGLEDTMDNKDIVINFLENHISGALYDSFKYEIESYSEGKKEKLINILDSYSIIYQPLEDA